MSHARTIGRPDGTEWYLSFGRILHSEWIKARSLHTTRRWGAAALVVGLVLGLLLAVALSAGSLLDVNSQRSEEVFDVTFAISVNQLVCGVVGVLTISGEYGSGMINSTFVAVPRRWPALLGKLVILVAVTYLLALVSMALTAVVTAPILKANGVPIRLTDPLVFGPILGGALYLGLIAAFAFFVGTIIRNTAAAISVTLGMLLVLPTLLRILSGVSNVYWVQNLVSFLPSTAGARLYAYSGTAGYLMTGGDAATGITLTTAQGLLVLLAWIVGPGIVAFALVKGRDA